MYGLRGLSGVCDGPGGPNYNNTFNPAACIAAGSVLTCTCIGGTCLEDGNSCSSTTAPSTNTTNLGYSACWDGSMVAPGVACPNQPYSATGITAWITANPTLAIGGAALLAVLMMGMKR